MLFYVSCETMLFTYLRGELWRYLLWLSISALSCYFVIINNIKIIYNKC